MRRIVGHIVIILSFTSCLPSPVLAGDAILPHGDPQKSDVVTQDRRGEIRKNRLKQQGQGENYRVEGKHQGGSTGPKAGNVKGHNRQETGIEDPTVNPGQASGLKTVQGRVLKSEENSITIEQSNGEAIELMIDPQTRLNTVLHTGDRVSGTVTNQGRAVVVKKESERKP